MEKSKRGRLQIFCVLIHFLAKNRIMNEIADVIFEFKFASDHHLSASYFHSIVLVVAA